MHWCKTRDDGGVRLLVTWSAARKQRDDRKWGWVTGLQVLLQGPTSSSEVPSLKNSTSFWIATPTGSLEVGTLETDAVALCSSAM